MQPGAKITERNAYRDILGSRAASCRQLIQMSSSYTNRRQSRAGHEGRSPDRGGQLVVSTTVMLESEWVQRSVHGFAGEAATAVLGAFPVSSDVSAENSNLLA